ncbi:MAG: hypothetical protein HYX74_09810 [Acidobacteria bacterium]|nr:hypothetical protein [Acidobacteriota bacterium]
MRALDAALDSRLPLAQLRGCFRRLAAAHPAMAVLANLARAISQAGSPRQVERIRGDLAGSNFRIARNFQRQLRRHFPRRFDLAVVTLSHSSTVLAALHYSRARIAEVRIARSLPLGEGAAARRAAARQGLRAALFDDAALRAEVRRCDLVVVGGDSVLGDGSVVNKVGTRLLARLCRTEGKPFWVLASQYKFSKRARVDLFQTVDGRRIKLFDVTPADLVDCLVTEAPASEG